MITFLLKQIFQNYIISQKQHNRIQSYNQMNSSMIKITEGFYYDPNKILGEGCFGKVYRGFSKQQNATIAVKEVQSAGYNQREVQTLKVLSSLVHPSIMSFYGFQVLSEKVYMFIEFLPNGTLTDLIHKGMSEQLIINVFRQILQGMCYINAKGQMHRDLKPDNILLGDKNNVKICDFGLARQASNDLRMTGKQGTPLYAAPQVYCKQEKYDQKIDVWSAGLILFEMIKGKNAFGHIKTFNDLHKQWTAFSKGKMQQMGENVHPEWQYLINIMLTYNPDKRPTFDDVLQKLKVIEPKMKAQIKIRLENPKKKYEQICGDKKWKKLKRYMQFFLQKSFTLVQPMQALVQNSLKQIKKSVQYLVMFIALARYLVRLKAMVKNLKYQQLQYPDGQQASSNQKDDKLLGILFDKYRNICQNLSIQYQDKLKNVLMNKILNQFDKNNEDHELYKKLQKALGMVIDIKNGCYDLQDEYQQMYQNLMKHELVCQNQYAIKKMSHDQLKAYSMLLLANHLDTIFPDQVFQKGILPKQWIDRLKKAEYQELLDFAIKYQAKK